MTLVEKYLNDCKQLLKQDDLFFYTNTILKSKLRESDLYYIKDDSRLTIYLKSESEMISYFTLTQLPGCCGICVSTGCWVDYNYRNKGLNTLLNNFRIEIAKYLGYTVLLCTDVEHNIAQKKVLEKNNWKQIDQFINKRTCNIVNIHTIHLNT